MSRGFVNTTQFSPVAIDGLPPQDSMYYKSFYEENYKYIMNGYTVGGERITGDHYWFLNFWKVRGTNRRTRRKEIIYPRFLEMQYIYAHELERARLLEKNMCLLKRRQIGATEFHAALGGKEFTFFPASQTVYVSGLDEYTKKLWNDTMRGLNQLSETNYFKNRNPKQADYVRASYPVTIIDPESNKTIIDKGLLSEIYAYTSRGNPQIVSSKSPSLIILEEFGIMANGIATYRFVEPSLYAESDGITDERIKTGMAIFAGTGGETDGALTGVGDLEKVFFNPDDFDCLSYDLSEFDSEVAPNTSRSCFFIPDWRFYLVDKDGNDRKEDSIAKLDKIREDKEDSDSLQEFCVTMPRRPADAFMLPSGGYFGKMIASGINKRRAHVMTHVDHQTREVGKLEWVRNGKDIMGIEWIPDRDGLIEIYEHPMMIDGDNIIVKDAQGSYPPNHPGCIVPQQLYFTGTDSYDKDEAKTSTSKGACIVRKGFHSIAESHGFFCAKAYMRSEKAYEFYENSAKLTYYYNSLNLIEWSNILIFDWYRRNNLEFLLHLRPDLVLANWIKSSQVDNRYGIDPSTKREWLSILKQQLKEQGEIERMLDLDLMKAFINYKIDPKYNCDLTIAASLCMVQINEMRIADETEDEKEEMKSEPLFGYKKGAYGLTQFISN